MTYMYIILYKLHTYVQNSYRCGQLTDRIISRSSAERFTDHSEPSCTETQFGHMVITFLSFLTGHFNCSWWSSGCSSSSTHTYPSQTTSLFQCVWVFVRCPQTFIVTITVALAAAWDHVGTHDWAWTNLLNHADATTARTDLQIAAGWCAHASISLPVAGDFLWWKQCSWSFCHIG